MDIEIVMVQEFEQIKSRLIFKVVDNIGYFFVYRWIFVPLWVFHAIVARGRFSLPAPCAPHDRHVNPSSIVFYKHNEICNLFPFYVWKTPKCVFLTCSFMPQWAPCHAVVAIPLLLAFEVLVCAYLDIHNGEFLL